MIAIWQIRKVGSTADAARRAAEAARDDRERLDAISHLSAAMAGVDEIKVFHRNPVWIVLPDRYARVRENVVAFRSTGPPLSETERASIEAMIGHLKAMETKVDRAIAAGQTGTLNPARFNHLLSNSVEDLQSVVTRLKAGRAT
ncbi:MAG: hypothetical protein R2729_31515 [Bryobacteraceae bacterium]